MTDPNEKKALQKMEEGDRKLKKNTGFISSIFGGGGSGVSDAIECYISAANYYKAAKSWYSAGETFIRVAELHEKHSDSKFDAGQNFTEAGVCFRKVDFIKATDCYQKAADIYVDMGKFTMAAKAYVAKAEVCESTLSGNIPEERNIANVLPKEKCKDMCLNSYLKAADFYKGEEQKSSASKCLVKVGLLAAELEQYQRAMHIFEEISIYESENNMLKYASRGHFFQALLCALCYDSLEAERALKRYTEISPIFKDSDEFKLFAKLLDSVKAGDPDGFTAAVEEKDKVARFDTWHTSILLKIKRSCGDGGEVKAGGSGDAEEDDDLR
uniref:Uncharacterized protein n=5 Tax=Meloidogyne TaxID=189290 RepID=A0A6V7U2I2_MELEN|nr:unnamed protein product [Meloidogyne enterolobii]